MADYRLHPGQIVKFRLGDIHLPEVAEVLARATEEVELEGSITLLSDHGEQRSAFAVIEVKGILMPLIVPTASLHLLYSSAPADSNPSEETAAPEAETSAVSSNPLVR